MDQKECIYQYFRCIEWSFPPNFKAYWDKRNKEWSQTLC